MKGRDYTCTVHDAAGAKVSPNKVVNAGKYTVAVRGKGAYEGSATTTFTVASANIKTAQVAKVKRYLWAGKAVKPNPKVTFLGRVLAKGTDYRLSYANNGRRGTATMTVKGKGNFKGAKVVEFTIV